MRDSYLQKNLYKSRISGNSGRTPQQKIIKNTLTPNGWQHSPPRDLTRSGTQILTAWRGVKMCMKNNSYKFHALKSAFQHTWIFFTFEKNQTLVSLGHQICTIPPKWTRNFQNPRGGMTPRQTHCTKHPLQHARKPSCSLEKNQIDQCQPPQQGGVPSPPIGGGGVHIKTPQNTPKPFKMWTKTAQNSPKHHKTSQNISKNLSNAENNSFAANCGTKTPKIR